MSSCEDLLILLTDTEPPRISAVAAPDLLWPPNHRMVPVTILDAVSENCSSVSRQIVSVTSNEAPGGPPAPARGPDWQITGETTLNLRAERLGPTRPRIYTITVRYTDDAGNVTNAAVSVTVP